MSEKDFESKYHAYQETQGPSEELIRNTLQELERAQEKVPVTNPVLRYAGVAAAMVVLVAVLLAIPHFELGGKEPNQSTVVLLNSSKANTTASSLPLDSSGENTSTLNESTNSTPNTQSESTGVTESDSDRLLCELNTITGQATYALPCFGAETHRYEYLTKEEVDSYLGKAIEPLLPEGLSEMIPKKEQKWEFIYLRETGELVFDVCNFHYADKFDQDGIPTADARTLSITASKRGYRFGIYYAEEAPKITRISGVDATFGQDKKLPVYSAEFKKDGVQYTVTGYRLSFKEIYDVVKSLLL